MKSPSHSCSDLNAHLNLWGSFKPGLCNLHDDPAPGGRNRNGAHKPQFQGDGDHAYLKSEGTLEKGASMANHASTRTTQVYDRRSDEVKSRSMRSSESVAAMRFSVCTVG